MRAASLALLALPLLLADCGSKQDLIIGEVMLKGDAGTVSAQGGSAGAEPKAGAPATAGAGGSTDAGTGGGGAENCVAGEEPPLDSLIHRYSFNAAGAIATDTISGADGNVVGTTLDGGGVLSMNMPLDPNKRQYVDLPNGIVSPLADVTLVAWTTWSGNVAYERVFDFGIGDMGETLGMTGLSYMAVMPKTGFYDQTKPGLGGEIKVPGFPTVTLASTENMKNRPAQVSFVFKGGVSAALYLDGNLLDSQATTITLANIEDRNNWIGQSQYATNAPYEGSYDEFRIYNAALDGCQLHTLLVRGPQSP